MRYTLKQTPTPQDGQPTPTFKPENTNWTQEKNNKALGFFSNFILIIGAFIFALAINKFAFQSYEVDGNSMFPTLHNSDRLIIWKLPKTMASIGKKDYVPKRGDIIVFHKPDGSNEQLIKRVVGLPGERVVVKDGKITVYNKSNPNGFQPDDAPYGKNLEKTSGYVDSKDVGEGEIFVVGDNRIEGASLDSRSNILGNVPLDMVVGKLVLRLYPFNDIKYF